MAWTDPAAVLALTGQTVSVEDCAVASAMIETFADVTEDAPDDAYSAKDVRHVRKAAGWQAPWVRDHPGLLTERENATSVSADSTNVQRRADSDGMLAPMAKRELMNLSWIRTHTVRVQPATPESGSLRDKFLNEAYDQFFPTRPL